jgi:hypothetical protein
MNDNKKDLNTVVEALLIMRGMDLVDICQRAHLPYDIVTAIAMINQGIVMMEKEKVKISDMETLFLKLAADCHNMKEEKTDETL